MTERDFVLAASMDLRWFPPKDAQRLLDAGLRTGLIVAEGGTLWPSFDIASVEIPLEFVPTAAAFEAATPAKEVFPAVVARIVEATGLDTKSVVAEVNGVQARTGIDLEAAVLLVARAHDVPVDDFLRETRSKQPAQGPSPRASRGRPR